MCSAKFALQDTRSHKKGAERRSDNADFFEATEVVKWGIVRCEQAFACDLETRTMKSEVQGSAFSFPLHDANACLSSRLRFSHLEMTASILIVSVPLATDRVSAMY
jgi:hypothetical protein